MKIYATQLSKLSDADIVEYFLGKDAWVLTKCCDKYAWIRFLRKTDNYCYSSTVDCAIQYVFGDNVYALFGGTREIHFINDISVVRPLEVLTTDEIGEVVKPL